MHEWYYEDNIRNNLKMSEKIIPLKEIAEEPIKIPENPFWQVFKRFGKDELIAMFVNVISTVVVSFFSVAPLVLSFAGPVLEKFGFFPANFLEARKIYKTTPERKRKKLSHYSKRAFKRSLTSLIEDILVHAILDRI